MVGPGRRETVRQERHRGERGGPVGMFGKPHSQTSHWTAEAPSVEVLQEIIWILASTYTGEGVSGG